MWLCGQEGKFFYVCGQNEQYGQDEQFGHCGQDVQCHNLAMLLFDTRLINVSVVDRMRKWRWTNVAGEDGSKMWQLWIECTKWLMWAR